MIIPSDRTVFLAFRLRRHFGEMWHAEPSMSFFADGTVRVSCSGQEIILSKDEADAFGDPTGWETCDV
jgi:hypothetical protein